MKKPRKPPLLTDEEKEGMAILDRVWLRMQQHGLQRDKFKTKKSQEKAKANSIDGHVLFESMVLVSKIRGRIRRGTYRPEGFKVVKPRTKAAPGLQKRKVILEDAVK